MPLIGMQKNAIPDCCVFSEDHPSVSAVCRGPPSSDHNAAFQNRPYCTHSLHSPERNGIGEASFIARLTIQVFGVLTQPITV